MQPLATPSFDLSTPVWEFGLIGKSLRHSFSRKYFTKKFHSLKICCKYSLFELENLQAFNEFPTKYPQLRGLNVTIPYKTAVLDCVQRLDESAMNVGAANTLLLDDSGKWTAYNTDCQGFEKSLRRFLGGTECPPALILGTGGAARAVDYVLKRRLNQADALFVSRKPEGANQIPWAAIDQELLGHYRLIVNATPTGTFPDVEAAPPLPYELLNERNLLFDLVYNPSETAFIKRGRAVGASVCNGLEMLHEQAEAAWNIWNSYLNIIPPPSL